MIPDDPELRRALEGRSAPPSDQYRARLRNALANGRRTPASSGWMTATAILVVVLVTVTSVGAVVAYRQAHRGSVASGPRLTSPTPGVESPSVYVSAPSPDVVWALVDDARLYRSTDRGEHWEARPVPESIAGKPTISFIDDREGWLLAPGSPTTQCGEATAVVWHTTDSAKSWQQVQTSGVGSAQCKEVVYFSPDARHGFITAWDDNHRPTVYWSVDRGQGWKQATLPDPPDFVSAPGGFNLRVKWIKAAGDTLYLEADGSQDSEVHDRQYVFISTDGGGTWVWKQKVASRELVVVTPSRWLEIDQPGCAPRSRPCRPVSSLSESTNGGQQMHPFDSNLVIDPASAPGQILFAGDSVGYVSRGGALQRTLDGGAHWTALGRPGIPAPSPAASPSPSPIELPSEASLSAPSRDVVWAFVDFRLLYVSQDRGQTWDLRRLPVPEQGGAQVTFSFADAENGWALLAGTPATQCQAAGVQIWRTSDGAMTWHEVASVEPPDGSANGLATAQCKEFISFVDTTHGFVTAWDPNSPPTIYRTADGGTTWKSSRLPDPPGFKTSAGGDALIAHEIHGFGSTLLVTAYGMQPSGGKGYVFKSVDGGATWLYAASLPDAAIEVAFVSGSRWLQVILPGQSVETTDAGRTWHAYASDYQQAAPIAPQVVFGDPSVGYATVRGSIQRTEDAGLHWSYIKTPGT